MLEALYNLVYTEIDDLEPKNEALVVLGEQEAGTRHLRGSRLSIPTSLTPFFQEYDLAQLDLDHSAGTIIPRVLEFGDKEEIRWLFSIYPRQDISDWVHRWGGFALREPHRTFWLLFLGI